MNMYKHVNRRRLQVVGEACQDADVFSNVYPTDADVIQKQMIGKNVSVFNTF
jgi:hypothetical protein